jgi:hypothetical protein
MESRATSKLRIGRRPRMWVAVTSSPPRSRRTVTIDCTEIGFAGCATDDTTGCR